MIPATSATRRTLLGVAAVAGFALLVMWDFGTENRDEAGWPRTLLGWTLILVGCAVLWWRRRRPVAVAVVTLVCAALYFPLADRDLPLLVIAFAIALFTVAAEGHLVAAGTLAAVTVLAILVSEQLSGQGQRHVDDTEVFLLSGWFVGLVAVGNAYGTRLAYLREAEQRALAAEREKDVRARQSATEERLRIARELHDVLGHNISLINVQAGAALHRYAKHGAEAAEGMAPALEAIRDASGEALRELRATLGILRQVDESAPTAPADDGLSRIVELAQRTESAGLRVRADVDAPGVGEGAPGSDGRPREPLPPRVGQAAYRIVQEALTNVVRHAGADSVVVRVRLREDAVRISVEDDGRGAPQDGDAEDAAGSGLRGMAERARALGGGFSAGNVRDETGEVRGFRVEAWLPVREGGRA